MGYNINKKDLMWSYLSYAFKYGSNLFILPFILSNLNDSEIGLWYTFSAVGSFVLLFDLGFSPTIMRNFSYAWSGAEEIVSTGFKVIKNKNPNYNLLINLILTSKFIYLVISIIALLVILLIGTPYIQSLVNVDINYSNAMTAWIIYCVAIFLNIYYSYWNPLLIGIGKISEFQKSTVLSQIVFLVISFIGFKFKLGLIAISMGYLFNGLVLRLSCKYYFKKQNIRRINGKFVLKDFIINIKILWHNAYRSALVSLGVYLETNINTIIASKCLGLAESGSYGLLLQIFLVIRVFSSTSIRTHLPEFNNLRICNKMEELKNKFSKNIVISWIMYIILSLIIILFGELLLGILGKQSILPNKIYLTVFSIQAFLVFNHGDLFSPIITTKNEIPFTLPTLLTGMSVGICSFVFVYIFKLGIWGLLFSNFICQIAYNNWKWPYEVLKDLNISLKYIIKNGIKELLNMQN